MKPIKRRKFIAVLEKEFSVVFSREGRGSHAIYVSAAGMAVIPHYEELSGELVKKVLKELGIDQKEFMRRLG